MAFWKNVKYCMNNNNFSSFTMIIACHYVINHADCEEVFMIDILCTKVEQKKPLIHVI